MVILVGSGQTTDDRAHMLIPATDTSNTTLTSEFAISLQVAAKTTHHHYSCHECGPKQVFEFQTHPTATLSHVSNLHFLCWEEKVWSRKAEIRAHSRSWLWRIEGLRVCWQKVTIIKFCDIIWFSCQYMRRKEDNENRFDEYTHKQIKSGSYINVWCQSTWTMTFYCFYIICNISSVRFIWQ